jgi:hypothetical protein
MNRLFLQLYPVIASLVVAMGMSSSSALCAQSTENLDEILNGKLNNPFLLPQTSFVFSNVRYDHTVTNSMGTFHSQLSNGRINSYGFELEVNYSKSVNIGGFFRFESLNSKRYQAVQGHFSTLLGGFTRLFYIPSFLDTNSVKTGLFVRGEIGGGPVFMQGPGGLLAHAGVSAGIEMYLNKWVGVSVSYGYSIQYIKETINNGLEYSSHDPFTAKNSSFSSRGQTLSIGLKTTFL